MKVALRRSKSARPTGKPTSRSHTQKNRPRARRQGGPLAHCRHMRLPRQCRPHTFTNMASTVRPKARSTIHEFDLIRALHRRHSRRTPSVIQGIGDDAAVITSRAGQWTVLTTDLLTEGVHFDLRTATMADIGFRAAAANLSDIAAMGGTPQYLLVAFAIPRTGSRQHVHQLYRGMMAACRPHHVQLIGGDTSASRSGWFLSLTLIGMVPPRKALFRSGARIGDSLYVTGTIGDALAGLQLLNEPPPRANHHPRAATFSTRHRQFLIDGTCVQPRALRKAGGSVPIVLPRPRSIFQTASPATSVTSARKAMSEWSWIWARFRYRRPAAPMQPLESSTRWISR